MTRRRRNHAGDDFKVLADGLYAGYMERFAIPDGPFDKWLEFCQRTLELDRGHREP